MVVRQTRESTQPASVRVYFDPQIFILQKHGGISKYFAELIRHYLNHPELGVLPVFRKFPMRLNVHAADVLGLRHVDLPRPLRAVIFALCALSGEQKADITHQTFYSKYYVRKKRPWTTTLYDMIPETYGFNGKRNPHLDKSQILGMARHIISISATSAREMQKLVPTVEATIRVIPLAGRVVKGLKALSRDCSRQFLLVGQRHGYKAGNLALEALSKLDSSHSLILAGPALSDQERKLIESLQLTDRVRQRSPSDSELDLLYQQSCALVFPSQTEGFGLPVLESMTLGVPVIAADNDVNREISDDALFYFSSGDSEALASQMKLVCSDRESLAGILERAAIISSSYNWYRTAELTAEFYREIQASLSFRAK